MTHGTTLATSNTTARRQTPFRLADTSINEATPHTISFENHQVLLADSSKGGNPSRRGDTTGRFRTFSSVFPLISFCFSIEKNMYEVLNLRGAFGAFLYFFFALLVGCILKWVIVQGLQRPIDQLFHSGLYVCALSELLSVRRWSLMAKGSC